MQKELLEAKLKAIKDEIAGAELMIGFYKWVAEKEEDKKKSSSYLVKADQMEEQKKFNETFLEYAETL